MPRTKSMEGIEHQFENFLNECKKEGFTEAQLRTICRPLLCQQEQQKEEEQQRWSKSKILAIVLTLMVLFYLLIYTFEYSSWLLSAIGRILLIELLPYWNWTPLYNSKCLIERELLTPAVKSTPSQPTLGRFETEAENCVLCENIEHIPTAANTSYSYLEAHYLEQGLPVIVTDSHTPMKLSALLKLIQTAGYAFLESEPCDLVTNIMLKQYFNLELGFQKIRTGNLPRKWFLQLRNCRFVAVKAARLFVTRPYYYPLHLEPYYTSWLLMSHEAVLDERRLYLRGLIFVQQLAGSFNIQLQPKMPCNGSCPVLNIELTARESLVFSTDIWIFHYSSKLRSHNVTALATILEIDWKI